MIYVDVIVKAHELAKAIEESCELQRLRELEVEMLNGNKIDEESAIYKEYTSALHQFTNLLEAINFILTSSYDGKLGNKKGCGHCCKK